jgi:hypothetical protein
MAAAVTPCIVLLWPGAAAAGGAGAAVAAVGGGLARHAVRAAGDMSVVFGVAVVAFACSASALSMHCSLSASMLLCVPADGVAVGSQVEGWCSLKACLLPAWLLSFGQGFAAAQADVSRRVVALQAEAARLAQRPDLSADDPARILTDRHAAYLSYLAAAGGAVDVTSCRPVLRWFLAGAQAVSAEQPIARTLLI